MYHLCRIYPDMPLKATSTVGYVGVAFFFVLSGFVLTWSTPIYNGVEAKSCEAFFYLCAPLLISVLNALKPLQRYLAAAAGAGVAWSIGLAMVCLRTGQVTTVSGSGVAGNSNAITIITRWEGYTRATRLIQNCLASTPL